ncbi:MAG: hypothetical protein IGS39_04380 [Calothrix sp. C42_A2020_038]|nr:hypothetical protein [Calothrix sp. C42_A2020_038]
MEKPPPSDSEHQVKTPEPSIRQQVEENSSVDGGMQAAIGNKNTQIQRDNEINIVENLSWSWKGACLGLIFGLITGFIEGLRKNEFVYGLIYGLVCCFALGLFFGMLFGLGNRQIEFDLEARKIANQGIKKSGINAVIIGLIVACAGVVESLNGQRSDIISGGLIAGFIVSLNFGGEACIKHFMLRLILYFNDYIPWNYARFLDYCMERQLLQRVGGRYRFIHRLLLEYFAQMELEAKKE